MTVQAEKSWQFQTKMVPAAIWELLSDKKLSETDLLIMAVVSSLVSHPSKGKLTRGCWASNRYIAKAIKRNYMQVSNRISHLGKMGLIISINEANQRFLELAWSRTAEERAALGGSYGEKLRAAHNTSAHRLMQQGITVDEEGVTVNKEGGNGQPLAPLPPEAKGQPLPIKDKHSSDKKNNPSGYCPAAPDHFSPPSEKKTPINDRPVEICTPLLESNNSSPSNQTSPDEDKNTTRTLHYAQVQSHKDSTTKRRVSNPSDGFFKSKKSKKKAKVDPLYLEWSDKLRAAEIDKSGRAYPAMPTSQRFARANELKTIHEEMELCPDLGMLIDFYCTHTVAKKDGELIIHSPNVFRGSTVLPWIRSAMKKDQKENPTWGINTPTSVEEIIYEDEKVKIERVYNTIRVYQGKIRDSFPVYHDGEKHLLYSDPEAGVEVSSQKFVATIKIGSEVSYRDLDVDYDG